MSRSLHVATHPRLEVVPAPLARQVAGRGGLDLAGPHGDGRGQAGAGGFGQDAQTAVIGLVVPGRGPEIVQSVHDHAGLARGGQVHGDARPDQVALLRQDRIDVGLDGVHPGRHEHARGEGALLVHVVDDLRVPDVVELGDGEPRLGLGEEVPIAIVVVAGVLLVKLGRRSALEARAQRFAVPARDDLQPIRVERGHEQEDRVVQNGAEARGVLGEQAIGELDGGMGGGELGGVDRAGDQDHRLAFADQLLGLVLGREARVGQLLLDPGVAVQVAERRGRGDGDREERPAFRALAELPDADAVRASLERLEVGDYAVPIQHGAVGAHLVAEVALGRGNGRGSQRCQGQDQRYHAAGGGSGGHRVSIVSDGPRA